VDSSKGSCICSFRRLYSPELNPDEQVWNHVKHHGVAKAMLQGGDELMNFVLARLRSLQKLPWTVRVCFPTRIPVRRSLNQAAEVYLFVPD